MTRRSIATIVLAGFVCSGIALAETVSEPKASPGAGVMGHAMGGPHAHGMMMGGGQGMCGSMPVMGMMGPMGGSMGCPMMLRGVDLRVEKRDDGVGLILTSKDPATIRRLQKRAEILRLMHELGSEEPDDDAR